MSDEMEVTRSRRHRIADRDVDLYAHANCTGDPCDIVSWRGRTPPEGFRYGDWVRHKNSQGAREVLSATPSLVDGEWWIVLRGIAGYIYAAPCSDYTPCDPPEPEPKPDVTISREDADVLQRLAEFVLRGVQYPEDLSGVAANLNEAMEDQS